MENSSVDSICGHSLEGGYAVSASLSFDSHWLWIPVIALVFLTLSVSTAYAEGLSEDIKALMGIPFDAEPEFKLVATVDGLHRTSGANAPASSLEAAHRL